MNQVKQYSASILVRYVTNVWNVTSSFTVLCFMYQKKSEERNCDQINCKLFKSFLILSYGLTSHPKQLFVSLDTQQLIELIIWTAKKIFYFCSRNNTAYLQCHKECVYTHICTHHILFCVIGEFMLQAVRKLLPVFLFAFENNNTSKFLVLSLGRNHFCLLFSYDTFSS